MVLFGHQGECVLRPLCTRNLEVRSLTSGGGDKTILVKQDGENHDVVYTGWRVRVMLKKDYSSY